MYVQFLEGYAGQSEEEIAANEHSMAVIGIKGASVEIGPMARLEKEDTNWKDRRPLQKSWLELRSVEHTLSGGSRSRGLLRWLYRRPMILNPVRPKDCLDGVVYHSCLTKMAICTCISFVFFVSDMSTLDLLCRTPYKYIVKKPTNSIDNLAFLGGTAPRPHVTVSTASQSTKSSKK